MGSVGYQVPSGEFAHPLISERAIDEPRPLKVIYLGAGVSGINAAIQLPKYVPNLDLTIYDKNDDAGGTWWENRYPGCACGEYCARSERPAILMQHRCEY
jgi:ribulose 1,5-bisphosphate synthetase/thiazole synthase